MSWVNVFFLVFFSEVTFTVSFIKKDRERTRGGREGNNVGERESRRKEEWEKERENKMFEGNKMGRECVERYLVS